jgi:CBS domain containing-hemolysin-like protein
VSTPVGIGLGVALLVINGLFVAAEFALLAARRSRIEQLAAQGVAGAKQAAAGLRELSLMLAGAQLGITICSLGLGAVAEPALAHLFEGALGPLNLPEAAVHAIGFSVALSIVVFLHLVVGEMAPKSWAIADPERSAVLLARPFRSFTLLFRPVIRVLNAAANGLVRLCRVEPQDERAMVHSSADLLLLVDESARHGAIPADDHRLLTRTIRLSGLTAGMAMTPRAEVVAVAADEALDAVAEVARTTGRSRLVVHDGDLDQVVGVVHAKDIILVDVGDRSTTTARDLARPAVVAYEDRPLEDVLVEMRTAHQHLAVVIDAGVVVGVVSLEDVLEELIGDFADETDLTG